MNANSIAAKDFPIHNWYRFILSFPPNLVRQYLNRFGADKDSVVLDPFCGTGTTLVECKKMGIGSVGMEAHPMTCFATQVKTDWTPYPDSLKKLAHKICDSYQHDASKKLSQDKNKLLLKESISPAPLSKILSLLDLLNQQKSYTGHLFLAAAKTAVESSNLKFGPEVGVGAIREDAPVLETWRNEVLQMANDLKGVSLDRVKCYLRRGDARSMNGLDLKSIDYVITSPPYPNEKDYTRTTRLESVLLGMVSDRTQLRSLKQDLVRSNSRNIYVRDEIKKVSLTVEKLADEIEIRRMDLGKTSGFERMYHKVIRLYFSGMHDHLATLRPLLKHGARLAYVLGEQASFFRVLIRTGSLFAEIAAGLGYTVEDIDLFRTRKSTVTGQDLREEVVILQWRK